LADITVKEGQTGGVLVLIIFAFVVVTSKILTFMFVMRMTKRNSRVLNEILYHEIRAKSTFHSLDDCPIM
jgi:hypothetical protein